ncbi:regulator of chromosome condensation [Anaeramoeba ignava]|uniref:Regulator of chromosome condensation n=1 Tax=Anaeramoeba ignava TaxID=1746090 RepID=A0A9Q0M0C4_ANAIG|nr:regulator of chromosome condensation [Anaeramoeba ignava]
MNSQSTVLFCGFESSLNLLNYEKEILKSITTIVPDNTIQITTTNETTNFLTSSGKAIIYKPGEKSKKIKSQKIKKISSGRNSFILLNKNGEVYSYGENNFGECACGEGAVKTPSLISYFAMRKIKIVEVVSGEFQTYFLSEDDELFTCGLNRFGQLGLGHQIKQSSPRFCAKNVTRVFSGNFAEHFYFINEKNELFSSGKNNCGQLGIGSKTHTSKYTKVCDMSGRNIVKICCGGTHTLLYLEENGVDELYSCGNSNYNGLGLSEDTTEFQLVKWIANKGISNIAVGDSHSVVLTKTNELYSFGSNLQGQLGQNTCISVKIPFAMDTQHFPGIHFLQFCRIYCGETSTFIYSSSFDCLLEDMHLLWKRSEFVDINFLCLDGSVSIHKLVLRARMSFLSKNQLDLFVIKISNFFKKQRKHLMLRILPDFFIQQGLLQDLMQLYYDEDSKDFIILSNNESIRVHKLILVARSDLYRGMFLNVNDPNNRVTDTSNSSSLSLKMLIKYFYFDSLDNDISSDSIQELQELKEFYLLNPRTNFFEQESFNIF